MIQKNLQKLFGGCQMQNNNDYEELEKRLTKREQKKRKEKEMKKSGKSVFNLEKIIKEKKCRKRIVKL